MLEVRGDTWSGTCSSVLLCGAQEIADLNPTVIIRHFFGIGLYFRQSGSATKKIEHTFLQRQYCLWNHDNV
jgi:hypothetical protein